MTKYAPAQISKALDHFSFIKQLIGIERLLSIAEKDHASPIIYYLSRSLPDESRVKELLVALKKNPKHIGVLIVLDAILAPYHILKHLDNCLSKIRDEKKLDVFLNHVLDSNSFWQGYCEVEVASNLKRAFGTIVLEPTLPNKKSADIRFPLNSENVFAEVTAPKKGYKYISVLEKSAELGKAVDLPSEEVRKRASDKILKELEHFS